MYVHIRRFLAASDPIKMDETSSVKRHQAGAVRPIVNCNEKAGSGVFTIILSIFVVIILDDIVHFVNRMLTRWERSYLKFHRHMM